MTYPAQELVTRAWNLSGIVAYGLQTVTGSQMTQGLYLLNALLAWKSTEIDLIPYYTYDTSITCVPNQETYFIPNCVDIESVTFNIDTVRYSLDKTSRKNYFATGRVDNISTLPYNWYFNRSNGGGTLYLYFLPAGEYPLRIMAKFALTNVSYGDDLSTHYDPQYIEYLRYELAQYMCNEYAIPFNDGAMRGLVAIRRQLMYMSPPDLSSTKISILTEGGGLNYGDVNIGQGYRPQ